MFRSPSKKQLKTQVETLEQSMKAYEEEVQQKSDQIQELRRENEQLQQQIEELQKIHKVDEQQRTQIVLYVNNDDISHIKPVTRINPRIIDTLIEEGYLDSSHYQDETAHHLALMVLANEATGFIISDFEATRGDDEFFEE